MLTILQANDDVLMHAIRRAHTHASMGFVSVSEPVTAEPAEPIMAATFKPLGPWSRLHCHQRWPFLILGSDLWPVC